MNDLRKNLPPLTSLLPFEAAARLESFSRAAEELHITQAAISRQVRGLEENLGVKLFVRRNRAVFLTDEGRRLNEAVSAALTAIADRAGSLRQAQRHTRVVLFCQLCEAFHWLMPRLASFRDVQADIEVQVVTSTRPLAEFTDPFDVALQTTARASGRHRLAFTAADEVFPVCSPSYLGSAGPLSLEALGAHRLLHYRAMAHDFMTWGDWLGTFSLAQVDPSPDTVFDSYPLMLQAAVAGHGIALGWRRTAGKLIEEGALRQACAQSVQLPQAISVYTCDGAEARGEVQAVLAWLQHQLLIED